MKKQIRIKKRGTTYYYMLPWDMCFHSTGCTREREANNYALERFNQGPPAKKTPFFGVYVQYFFIWEKCRWIEASHKKGRSFSKESAKWRRGHVVNHLEPKLGDLELPEITANHIDDVLLSLTVSNATRNKILDTVSIIMNMACRDGIIKKNPTDLVSRFSESPEKRDVFHIDELVSLFPNDVGEMARIWGSEEYAAFFSTLAFSGIRVGEARVLEWPDIRFDLNLITINKALKNGGGIGTTKNGEQREVFMTERLHSILTSLKSQSSDKQVFPSLMKARSERGQYNNVFRTALINAEIQTADRNLVPHCFRHTFNTLLRHEFGEDTLVMKLLGHKSSAMTDNYYNPTADETSRFLSKHTAAINGLFSSGPVASKEKATDQRKSAS